MRTDSELPPGEVTRLLGAVRNGDRDALHRVITLVYDDLRQLAERQLGREHAERTLRPTDLVHEAYLKLAGPHSAPPIGRTFLAIAAHAMRQVLVDEARKRNAVKRGLGWERATLSDAAWSTDIDADEMLALDDAMSELEPRQRQVIECRFFAGMDEPEVAAALGVSDRTVRRDWVKARAWLYRRLYGDVPAS